jgi:hypothetical protein
MHVCTCTVRIHSQSTHPSSTLKKELSKSSAESVSRSRSREKNFDQVYVCMYVCVYVCVCVHAYMGRGMCAPQGNRGPYHQRSMHTDTHANKYVHMYVYAYVYTCLCIHVHRTNRAFCKLQMRSRVIRAFET